LVDAEKQPELIMGALELVNELNDASKNETFIRNKEDMIVIDGEIVLAKDAKVFTELDSYNTEFVKRREKLHKTLFLAYLKRTDFS